MSKQKKMGCGIYMIRSITKPEKFYIGSTNNFNKRFSMHKRWLERGKHHNIILQHHVNKYGIQDLEFFMIERFEFVSTEHLISREQFYLDFSLPCFNISDIAGCGGSSHASPSQETRDKIAEGMRGWQNFKGHSHTEETIKKISEGNKGKPKSDAHRAALSKAWEKRRLIPESEETRKKKSKATKGRVPWNTGLTKETDPRLMEMSLKMTGKKVSQETGEKISKALKGKPHSEEHTRKVAESNRERARLRKENALI